MLLKHSQKLLFCSLKLLKSAPKKREQKKINGDVDDNENAECVAAINSNQFQEYT